MSALLSALPNEVLQTLFDRLPDTMFFLKDREGRYTMVNDTLVRRSGKRRSADLLGKTASALFPGPLGDNYTQQDLQVIAKGQAIQDKLELYHLPRRTKRAQREPSVGWCLTHKFPLRGPGGQVVGVAGISRDLPRPDERSALYRQLAQVFAHIQARCGEGLTMPELARLADLSQDQLERGARQVFGLTPKQLVIKVRLEAASTLLRTSSATVSDVAHQCGYADHGAFSRQFRSVVGLTPSQYRAERGQAQG